MKSSKNKGGVEKLSVSDRKQPSAGAAAVVNTLLAAAAVKAAHFRCQGFQLWVGGGAWFQQLRCWRLFLKCFGFKPEM